MIVRGKGDKPGFRAADGAERQAPFVAALAGGDEPIAERSQRAFAELAAERGDFDLFQGFSGEAPNAPSPDEENAVVQGNRGRKGMDRLIAG